LTSERARNPIVAAARSAAAGLLILWGGSGCQAPAPTSLPPSFTQDERSWPEEEVQLAPGDVIDVKFFYSPELNELQTIRPDGKISLQLIGEVDAAGKTPAELQFLLSKLYSRLLEKPEVAVIVRNLDSRSIWVGGAVRSPGRITRLSRLTALGAIVQAGGFNLDTAAQGHVVILRENRDHYDVGVIDLRDTVHGHGEVPVFLEPRDIVYVTEKPIHNVNRWVSQYINRVVPDVRFSIFRTVNDNTTIGYSGN
jgi:protein involved in polysaccharide export with SLBB domain